MSEQTTSPEELLALAREGDEQARGRLLDVYRGYLMVLARVQIGRRLQGKADDSDLIQDTFLEAHRHFSSFRGRTERELTAWLRQILATNVALLVRRYVGTQQRDVRLERDLSVELDHSSRAIEGKLVSGQSSPSQQASRRERAVILADAIAKLPPDYQEVVILSHLEGLSFPEVARRMKRSVDSVKNLWARALGRLRSILKEAP